MMSASTLSKRHLMSRNRDETWRTGRWSVRTVSVRAVQASKEESERREPHWLRWRRPTYLATTERQEAIILSRIFEMVWRRTMIRNDDGES